MSGTGTLPRTAAVIVAAGQGMRAGQPVPKQFAIWRGKQVLRHSAEALAKAGISPIAVAIPEGANELARDALSGVAGVHLVTGGATRQESVRLALESLEADAPERVLIHDAARPILPAEVIVRLQEALDRHSAAIPVLPVADSLLVADGKFMRAAADREVLRRVQTPQAFVYAAILSAHRDWEGEPTAGDDAQVARAAGIDVALIEGDEALHKLTYSSDFEREAPPVRVGQGYDVHRLEAGEELWLCGVRIEHETGLAGHSDADVAIHALVDALLGAAGAGDIGQHFPPGDPQWKGAASSRFLEKARDIVTGSGYGVGNVDVTIICEAPRIGPHRDTMRASLADLLGIDITDVSVKATTTERLGFTGRREGIAAQAVVTLVRY
ncbi:MAG: bifunctional 2-C-methyl-D-erythritol 4-phosphate cytidylyltransferase/2-C-methyl-D-erythritol 2,4-cyclodiphosphate synthase [Novosphingobium sp.]|nr:bifunctional 2-C-methyl-D-erythritol 4-phosphate cytidylyltransferase/2-C-methyl-D-erythritol 2,4-cyclodiphosphate synthase [Novosphingobium sp.]